MTLEGIPNEGRYAGFRTGELTFPDLAEGWTASGSTSILKNIYTITISREIPTLLNYFGQGDANFSFDLQFGPQGRLFEANANFNQQLKLKFQGFNIDVGSFDFSSGFVSFDIAGVAAELTKAEAEDAFTNPEDSAFIETLIDRGLTKDDGIQLAAILHAGMEAFEQFETALYQINFVEFGPSEDFTAEFQKLGTIELPQVLENILKIEILPEHLLIVQQRADEEIQFVQAFYNDTGQYSTQETVDEFLEAQLSNPELTIFEFLLEWIPYEPVGNFARLPVEKSDFEDALDAMLDGFGNGGTRIVSGSEVADTMLVGYVDADGDAITDGDDVIDALSGDDVIYTGKGADEVHAGDGNDSVYAGRGSKNIFGDAGNDYITVIDGSIVDGGDGNDHLYGRLNKGGDHTFTGGAGADLFEFNYAGTKEADQLITDFEVGVDTLRVNNQILSNIDIADLPSEFTTSVSDDGSLVIEYGGIHSVTLSGISEAEFFVPITTPPVGVDGTEGHDNMNVGFTDADGDQITDGYDVILALGGNDTIRTGNGDDLVYAGAGDDTVYSGRGSKTIYGEAGNDYITVIDGSIVDGGDGNDHLYGRLNKGGDHTFTGGAGADLFEFNYAGTKEADQLITDFEVGVDTLRVNNQILSNIDIADLPSEFTTSVSDDGSLVIEYGGIHSVTLSGITEAEFFI